MCRHLIQLRRRNTICRYNDTKARGAGQLKLREANIRMMGQKVRDEDMFHLHTQTHRPNTLTNHFKYLNVCLKIIFYFFALQTDDNYRRTPIVCRRCPGEMDIGEFCLVLRTLIAIVPLIDCPRKCEMHFRRGGFDDGIDAH